MALKDCKLTSTGDLELNTLSQPTSIYEADALRQIVAGALSLWLGNWYADTTRGVDWLNVLKFNYNRAEIISIIKGALRRVSYVSDVVDVSLKVTERKGLIAYTVETTSGLISGEEVL